MINVGNLHVATRYLGHDCTTPMLGHGVHAHFVPAGHDSMFILMLVMLFMLFTLMLVMLMLFMLMLVMMFMLVMMVRGEHEMHGHDVHSAHVFSHFPGCL